MEDRKAQKVSSQYRKMTGTPIPRLVITLSIPSVISMLVTNIYNLADTAFVGRLGTSASGAVGVVFGFMAIIQAFSFMFGQGSGSILSRALGSQDGDAATMHASAGFFGAMFCGLLIALTGFLRLDDIVTLLGSTETIAPYAKTYISFILAAAPFMSGSLTLNNILRYEGKASLGMIGLMLGAVLNIIGDPILMFGLKMGIAGAGLSTAISQIISWGVLVSFFLTGRTETGLSFQKAVHAAPAVYGNICSTGFPSFLRQGLNSLTTMLLNAQSAVYGDAAVAAERHFEIGVAGAGGREEQQRRVERRIAALGIGEVFVIGAAEERRQRRLHRGIFLPVPVDAQYEAVAHVAGKPHVLDHAGAVHLRQRYRLPCGNDDVGRQLGAVAASSAARPGPGGVLRRKCKRARVADHRV